MKILLQKQVPLQYLKYYQSFYKSYKDLLLKSLEILNFYRPIIDFFVCPNIVNFGLDDWYGYNCSC